MRLTPFSKLLPVLVIMLVLLAALLSGCNSSNVTLSSLSISPEKTAPGSPVTIAVNLLNSGSDTEYQADLKINDKKLETKKNISPPVKSGW